MENLYEWWAYNNNEDMNEWEWSWFSIFKDRHFLYFIIITTFCCLYYDTQYIFFKPSTISFPKLARYLSSHSVPFSVQKIYIQLDINTVTSSFIILSCVFHMTMMIWKITSMTTLYYTVQVCVNCIHINYTGLYCINSMSLSLTVTALVQMCKIVSTVVAFFSPQSSKY